MSFDGVVTYAAVKELGEALISGKIKKIHQPHSEQLLFSVHTHNGIKKLFISVSGNHSGIYLIDNAPENPLQPPVFCMVLRKHLNGARIADIRQYENDRIIELHFETVNEMGFDVSRKLIVEIMGKHSNAILTDAASGKIIDSIKHVSIDVNRARQVLPGKIYEYPPSQHKVPFSEVSAEYMQSILQDELQPDRCIMSAIQGISPSLATSLTAHVVSDNLSTESAETVFERIDSMKRRIEDGHTEPVVYSDENNIPVDFHITPLQVYENDYKCLHFDTFSEAANYFFSHRTSSNTLKQQSSDLLRIVNAALGKLQLKTQRLNEDLYKAENSDKYRLYGELLTANLHIVKTGADSVTVVSYYDGNPVTIPLDPKLSPAKNAQSYYKKYGKYKTAVKEKKLQLEETAKNIEYLESVAGFIEQADSAASITAIRQELTDEGFIRYKKSRDLRKKGDKPKPHSYSLSSGAQVMAGKNNKENDWLTFKKAASNDIWFHTKDIPGSHIILFTEGREASETDLFEAASIAAYHSKGTKSENVPVDYTKVRYVKKPAGAKPGMVIFTHNKTLYVNPKLP